MDQTCSIGGGASGTLTTTNVQHILLGSWSRSDDGLCARPAAAPFPVCRRVSEVTGRH